MLVFLAPKWTKMLKYAKKKITFINSIKHILAEYDENICFEDRAEFHPSWPYSFAFASENLAKFDLWIIFI
jgi:hypothetical protein